MRLNADRRSCVSPRTGHGNVYLPVSASYMSHL